MPIYYTDENVKVVILDNLGKITLWLFQAINSSSEVS